MDVYDFLLAPLYLALLYFLALRTRAQNSNNFLYQQYYLKGLNYKFIGATVFALVYVYYYGGGDTVSFYYAISPLFKLFFKDPGAFFKFCFNPYELYPPACIWEAAQKSVIYLLRGTPTLTTIKIGGIINMFCFNSYLALSLVFAYLSYQFQWRIFKLVCSVYPSLHKQFSYALLMIPSVIFWGSGLSKDTIMLSAIMMFIYAYYQMAINKRQIFKYLFIVIVTGYLISLVRGFILFTMVPCLILMTVAYYQGAIRSSMLRFLVAPLFIAVGVLGSFFFVRTLGQNVDSYSVESLQQKAEGFRSWHTTRGGSTYSIGEGELEFTFSGIMSQAPMAVITTLYGPFVWQIRNVLMLLSGIESLIFLYLTIRIVFNKRIYALFGVLFGDHLIAFCLPFIIVLSIAIGLTSFNYGALVRYKIPIMPFLGIFFIVVNYHLNRSEHTA